jgi:hypothetical protein
MRGRQRAGLCVRTAVCKPYQRTVPTSGMRFSGVVLSGEYIHRLELEEQTSLVTLVAEADTVPVQPPVE